MDVFELEVRVGVEDLLSAHAFGEYPDDRRDRDAQTTDAGDVSARVRLENMSPICPVESPWDLRLHDLRHASALECVTSSGDGQQLPAAVSVLTA